MWHGNKILRAMKATLSESHKETSKMIENLTHMDRGTEEIFLHLCPPVQH